MNKQIAAATKPNSNTSKPITIDDYKTLLEEYQYLNSLCSSQKNQIKMLQKLVDIQKKFINQYKDEELLRNKLNKGN